MAEGETKKSQIAVREEEILKFWQENKIFEKTLSKPAPKGFFGQSKIKEYVFYDGPPFATGLPHYGHILASTIKDAVPRFWTMRGYHVPRRWGWDCHGLPIENIVEKELKISGRKQIEAYGVDKFNEYARSKVSTFVADWKKTIERIGRWVDFDGSYKTMDNSYIESVWWAFKQIYEKGLIYEGTRVLPYCPRCETPIANSEIAMDNSYRDITDISVYVKFELLGRNGEEKGEKSYLLVWTTTPWTLPGNFALAVNTKVEYVKLVNANGESVILAKSIFEKLMKEKVPAPLYKAVFDDFGWKNEPAEYKAGGHYYELSGEELVGRRYRPPFAYFTERVFENKDRAWKVYGGDFVTTVDGTGVVHVAPGYGEDDINLSRKENIPFIHHVTGEGRFTADVLDFAGKSVKPRADSPECLGQGHQVSDIEIIKNLASKNLLFAKEKIIHSYPHCYRCETPLYYYAIPAWFVKISEVKNRLLKLNEKIHWVPDHLKEGRFKKSIEGAPDWNISRNRFWASPLPVWKCQGCGSKKVAGSLADISESRGNNYFVMRHGEAENNVAGIHSTVIENPHHLTERGKTQVLETVEFLRKKKIDRIYCSPFVRTRETAELVAKSIGFSGSIIVDSRLKEVMPGLQFEGKKVNEDEVFYGSREERFHKVPAGGETYNEIKKRVGDFIYETDEKYSGENILIVLHDGPARLLFSSVKGLTPKETVDGWSDEPFLKNAEVKTLDFRPLPHNLLYELDFHRPYIDNIKLGCRCGKKMERVNEVIDCWFESGSMPFSSIHYPFENSDWFKSHFPAEFIAEYIAQTRTWFYYMHVLSTALFDSNPFKNVVTTGTILAEDGEKMSKSKGNYPDPSLVFEKYGVDALRYYLLSSAVMKSEDLNFSERDLDSVYKKVFLRLDNVLSFYLLYAGEEKAVLTKEKFEPKNVLDRWLVARLNQLISEVNNSMEKYELENATRPIDDFVDDLSTWYIRRSRERFKSVLPDDRDGALSTTRYVLAELAKVLAPFAPFVAEHIHKSLVGGSQSVHLENWPAGGSVDLKLIEGMAKARSVVSLVLQERAKANIKVRQPLRSVRVKSWSAIGGKELAGLIKDEVNVKDVVADGELLPEIWLDTTITPELKEEGDVREIVRTIQELRKSKGMTIKDSPTLVVEAGEFSRRFVEKYSDEIKKGALLAGISFGPVQGQQIKLDDVLFSFDLSL